MKPNARTLHRARMSSERSRRKAQWRASTGTLPARTRPAPADQRTPSRCGSRLGRSVDPLVSPIRSLTIPSPRRTMLRLLDSPTIPPSPARFPSPTLAPVIRPVALLPPHIHPSLLPLLPLLLSYLLRLIHHLMSFQIQSPSLIRTTIPLLNLPTPTPTCLIPMPCLQHNTRQRTSSAVLSLHRSRCPPSRPHTSPRTHVAPRPPTTTTSRPWAIVTGTTTPPRT